MEKELANQLLHLAALYCEAKGIAETTVGRLSAADGKFFARVRAAKHRAIDAKEPSFTVRKRDEVVQWFAANWPDGVAWPDSIEPVSQSIGSAA